jgi:hypothetical protein
MAFNFSIVTYNILKGVTIKKEPEMKRGGARKGITCIGYTKSKDM